VSARLCDALEAALEPPLRERLPRTAAAFLERYGGEPVRLDAALLRGVARVLASQPAAAGFLARRRPLAERLFALGPRWLEERLPELHALATRAPGSDLEAFLDEVRLLRREETLLAACLDLGERVAFEEVSRFLSALAESIVRRTLAAAELRRPEAPLAVIAMGKLAGGEFTYGSDLDLVFLTPAGFEGVESASRLAQRLVSFLATPTGAGTAYAVDARLRPSGQQGMLVTSFAGFEDYQLARAETWEHLALLRARAIAGCAAEGQAVLDRVRASLLSRRADPWPTVAAMRRRVHAERAREGPGRLAFKTGAGGIMDLEFLAAAGVLERGPELGGPVPPSVPGMLRAAAAGARVDRLLDHYRLLRRLEARARFAADRALEVLDPGSELGGVVAALLAPGEPPASLWSRIEAARREVAGEVESVLAADCVRALER
jgi:glutamate-ammonia-ligase adenylyltransferase